MHGMLTHRTSLCCIQQVAVPLTLPGSDDAAAASIAGSATDGGVTTTSTMHGVARAHQMC